MAGERYLCDTSVWLALSLQHHVHHALAGRWFDTVDRAGAVRFCRSTQQSLLRLLTTSSVFAVYGDPPLSSDQAWNQYERLRTDDRIGFEEREPTGLESHWRRFTARPSASPKLWMDAYLAAFAIAAGLRLVTTDTAFRQFPELDLLVLGAPAPTP